MKHSPVLALHGNLGSKQDWDELEIPGLRSVDLWDHVELSFFEMAHELATTLSEGMERPVLAGYSLGGRLALHAMAIHPERWSGAVIASAHPGLCCVEDRMARRVSDEVWARDARELPWQEFLQKWNGQGVLASSSVSARQETLEERRAEIALAFETWTLGRQEDLRVNLRGFPAPVLWLTGGEDQKFTELGKEMGEYFPQFRHEVLPECGHRVLGEPLAQKIGEWLSQLSQADEA